MKSESVKLDIQYPFRTEMLHYLSCLYIKYADKAETCMPGMATGRSDRKSMVKKVADQLQPASYLILKKRS